MIEIIRNEIEQKTNRESVYFNTTEFHCNENTSSCSDGNDTNENRHDSSDFELGKTVQPQE